MGRVNEGKITSHLKQIENKADRYFKKYRSQMLLLEKTNLAKMRGITPYDYAVLGGQLEAFDYYTQILDNGSLNQLGRIPYVAYDVLTISYGGSIIPYIASVQNIYGQKGGVYFRNVVADTSKGNQTSGDNMISPFTGQSYIKGFASNRNSSYAIPLVAGTSVYTVTLPDIPIAVSLVNISISTTTATDVNADAFGKDSSDATSSANPGSGTIIGSGLDGTINYKTGAVTITLSAAPLTGVVGNILIDYQVAYDQGETALPTISTFWDNKYVEAKIYVLKGTLGLLQSYAMKKRFGIIAEEELAKDLIGEINAEIGGDLINLLLTKCPDANKTSWNKTPPANVSYFEHKQTLVDSIAEVEALLVPSEDRGTISIIVDTQAVAILSTLPQFVKLYDGKSVGPILYGTFNEAPVIRVPIPNLMTTTDNVGKVLVIWKGSSPFEAPAVYCPYMPLVVTTALPKALNSLGILKATAVWAATDVIVPNFIASIDISNANIVI